MLNFWTLSAIAAFCLGEVHSQFGSGGLNIPNIPNRGGDGLSPSANPNIPMPEIQIGDDKIRIACITLFCRLTFPFGHFIAASN